MKLHRKLGKTIPDVELPLNNSATTTTNPQEEKVPTDTSVKLIGEEYIEITYDESRKPIVFHCKLCDCKFNDANAKDAHLKGKRHRLSYRVTSRKSFVSSSKFLLEEKSRSELPTRSKSVDPKEILEPKTTKQRRRSRKCLVDERNR